MDPYKGLTPCMLLLLTLSGAVSAVPVVNGVSGGSVEFSVSAPTEANNILWTYKGSPVAQLFPGGDPFCVGQFIGRCNMSRNGSLRLHNINKTSDQGEYTMTAQNNGVILDTQIFQLSIYTSLKTPVLKLNSTSAPASALVGGTDVTLHCDAGDQDVTTYTFYQNQVNASSKPHVTSRGAFLDFRPIGADDSGTYNCTIQNPVSSNTSNHLDLTVIVPVSNVTLTINTSNSLIWPGKDSVSLNCSAIGTNVVFSWYLQGAPLPPNPRYHLTNNNFTLIISPVSASDNGSFTCKASNSISNETSNNISLNLASPVSAVTLITTANASELLWEGEASASLYCSAQGSAIDFSWRLNGQLLSNTTRYRITQGDSPPNSNLTISPVNRADNGSFYCTASNLENSMNSSSLSLNLAWRPDGNILCSANTSSQGLQLICSWSGGNPAANVTMEFNNENTSNPNQVIRTLALNTNVQGSTMTCRGDQDGRTDSCTLQFDPPVFIGKNNTDHGAIAGGNAVMTASLSAVPQAKATGLTKQVLPATFSWFRMNPDRISIVEGGRYRINSTGYSSSLQISEVTTGDKGTYECTATNFIGTQKFTFNLVVSTASSGLSGGAIAGIVIGVLAGVAIIGIIIFFIVKKK